MWQVIFTLAGLSLPSSTPLTSEYSLALSFSSLFLCLSSGGYSSSSLAHCLCHFILSVNTLAFLYKHCLFSMVMVPWYPKTRNFPSELTVFPKQEPESKFSSRKQKSGTVKSLLQGWNFKKYRDIWCNTPTKKYLNWKTDTVWLALNKTYWRHLTICCVRSFILVGPTKSHSKVF